MIICKKNNWLFFSETRRYQKIDWKTTRIRLRPILLFDNARLQKLLESKYEILQIFHQIDCHSFLHLRLFFQQNKIFDAEEAVIAEEFEEFLLVKTMKFYKNGTCRLESPFWERIIKANASRSNEDYSFENILFFFQKRPNNCLRRTKKRIDRKRSVFLTYFIIFHNCNAASVPFEKWI